MDQLQYARTPLQFAPRKTASGQMECVGSVIRRCLFALGVISTFIALRIACSEQQENLQSVCERLEKFERTRAFRGGVDECRRIGDHDSTVVLAEPNPLVQERYLADRANLLLAYADIQKNPDDKKALAVEALRSWIDYFSWFNDLSDSTQAAVVHSYQPKLYAAAAGLGIAALDAEDPKSALSQYEQLKDVFFNRKAIRLWLAALLYPKHPVPIDDMIFAKTASDSTLLKQLSQGDRAGHWRNFYERMEKLEAAKHGANDLVTKLRLLFPPKRAVPR